MQEARERDELAELRRLIAKYPEEGWPIQRPFIESTVSALLGVIYRYEDEIDPDHETITAIGHGKALQVLLRS